MPLLNLIWGYVYCGSYVVGKYFICVVSLVWRFSVVYHDFNDIHWIKSGLVRLYNRKSHINVTTILLESPVILAIAQAILLATATKPYEFTAIYQIVGQLQVLAPSILVYRALQRRTWDLQQIEIILKTPA
ncbi:hypothetical protein BDQ17DRAFT_1330421 [Cyathus striatus]|nr:hypothetical protein BDQ17DRAFT_1330421 [Cyathus striatus]